MIETEVKFKTEEYLMCRFNIEFAIEEHPYFIMKPQQVMDSIRANLEDEVMRFAGDITIPGKCIETKNIVLNVPRFKTWRDHLKYFLKTKYPRLFGKLRHEVNWVSKEEKVDCIWVYPDLQVPYDKDGCPQRAPVTFDWSMKND